jgi:putative DNA methylase
VQYAELIDFCYVWLHEVLSREEPTFAKATTRTELELTGNVTERRDLIHFTARLSRISTRYAAVLKPGRPFVFTYHHNRLLSVYATGGGDPRRGHGLHRHAPRVSGDGGIAPHRETGSSILDSIFVCRCLSLDGKPQASVWDLEDQLLRECGQLRDGGVRITEGDIHCLALGHLARLAIARTSDWDRPLDMAGKLSRREITARLVGGGGDR